MNLRPLFCTLLAVLALPYGAEAQEKRLLTMEETILSRELIPENIVTLWGADSKGKTIYGTATSPENVDWFYPTNGKSATPATKAEQSVKPRYFAEENNLFAEIAGEKVTLTDNEDKNIVSGSFVSRNEFGIMEGIFPSPDGLSVAFYQKDESKVGTFPLLDITTRTGSLREIKYPMAGMDSERVRVGVWDSRTRQTIWLAVTDFDEERYITNITWSPNGELIYTQVLNRDQNEMHLNSYCSATGAFVETILTESDSRYVEPLYPLQWLDTQGERFIYSTNVRDGYWNLYVCSRGKEGGWNVERLTKVDADVTYLDRRGEWVYYYTAEFSTAEQHLAKVSTKSGKSVRLTHEAGWHNCSISPCGKYLINNYSALYVPRVVNLASTKDGKVLRNLLTAADPTEGYNYTPIELGTIPTADGKWENWYRLIYPLDFDPAKKYPAIVYVYGGPHSQMVNNSYLANLRRWEMYMAQRGYVVFVMDNRGTLWHGAEYEKAIHRQCGKCEMEDQMKGVEWLLSHEWVDAERVGVHGWSYGGFMTISLMTHHPEVFKVGVAGGPVIDWKWYEAMYGERYMDRPEQNPEGYAATSLINQVKNLKGKLLICQGGIDPVVLWQHSLSFVRECVVNNVQVDYFPYPCHEHNVRGKDRVHLMDKVTMYFDDYL